MIMVEIERPLSKKGWKLVKVFLALELFDEKVEFKAYIEFQT